MNTSLCCMKANIIIILKIACNPFVFLRDMPIIGTPRAYLCRVNIIL